MKYFKRQRAALFSGIISFTLSALGFASCDDFNDNKEEPIILMYGVPSAEFKIIGKIVAEDTKRAVRDLQISVVEYSTWTDHAGIYYENQSSDTLRTKTNADGSFSLNHHSFPNAKKYIYLIEDVDGDANGRFQTKKDSILFKNPKYKDGDGAWFDGTATMDFKTITVKPEK